MAPKGKVCKKPAAATTEAENFVESYVGVCTTPLSLPYPDKGGRRADLIPQCGAWVRASRFDEEWTHYAKATSRAGFLAIHECNRQEKPDTWDLTNEKAQSWAKQMTARLQHLLRHCKQAEGAMPKWLKDALDGTSSTAKAEKVEEADAFLAGEITMADVEAALQEGADSAADAEGGEEEEVVRDPLACK